jgi:Flp pilus assembly pilin Flp
LGGLTVQAFIIGLIAAGVIAIGSVAVLNSIQKPVDTAFTTSSVRI